MTTPWTVIKFGFGAATFLLTMVVQGGMEVPTVLVADSGNDPDVSGFGAVDYEYYIGKYEVTNEEYAHFLNAAAKKDPNGLYDPNMSVYGITRSGESGNYAYALTPGLERHPVVYVSFWDACRFANWLTNGQGTSGTETGVYDLTNSGAVGSNTVTRNLDVWNAGGVAIASEDEWYKAAYFDPTLNSSAGGYWLYPTKSDTEPSEEAPNSTNPNSANHTPPGSTTEVGAYSFASSYYGTFDQGGNVFEWNDTILVSVARGNRGGSYDFIADGLAATYRSNNYPIAFSDSLGFRLSSLEPIFHPKVLVHIEMSLDGLSWESVNPGTHTLNAATAYFRPNLEKPGKGPGKAIQVNFPSGGGSVEVALAKSTDLENWSGAEPGFYHLTDREFFRVETINAFSLILPGTFIMGSPEAELGRYPDETQHQVTLTRPFYMHQTELTKAEWDAVRIHGPDHGYTDLAEGTYGYGGGLNGAHPVAMVSWFDVVKWLNLKSELEGLIPCYVVEGSVYKVGRSAPDCNFDATGYRLPTESEWEYACRAGTTTAFYSGPITYTLDVPLDPNLDLIAWYGGNSSYNTHPVGLKLPNDWVLYDQAGNVSEWCWDWVDTYPGTVTDPTGPSSGTERIVRGSSTHYYALYSRSANRGWIGPDSASLVMGFRPARTASMVEVQGGTLPALSSLSELNVDSFMISRTEVTWGEWKRVRDWAVSNGYDLTGVGDGCADIHPVHSVNWYDVVKWCNAKSELENLTPVYSVSGVVYKSGEPDHTTIAQDISANGYRLPQEAEWEFAARGGNLTNGYTYSGSNDLGAVGWYGDNSSGAACDLWEDRGTWPVAQKAANELGLYDMSGNVWEWCWDSLGDSFRQYRGGSWSSSAVSCSVSWRINSSPDYRNYIGGFRFARSFIPEEMARPSF